MANIVSGLRKISSKFLKRSAVNTSSPLVVKRAKVLNDKSSFHVKEAYKALRTNVVFTIPHDGAKKIIVTSALAGEGKSTNCLNLAISFAQTGAKVLIIDCDLRKPNIANLLNIPSTPGLSNSLANLSTIDSTIVHSDYANLDVIPSGDMPPNPAELLGSAAMKDILDKLSEIYEKLGFTVPEFYTFDLEEVKEAITHDKKASNQNCSVVFVSKIGNGSIEEWTMEQVLDRLEC